jgi:hypothetical protein
MGDLAGYSRGSYYAWTCEIDLALLGTHSSSEITICAADSYLTNGWHAKMIANTWTTTRAFNYCTRIYEGL